jgi:hypothetical protein
MTTTHAAIRRAELIRIGFGFDSVTTIRVSRLLSML